ncbi:MULTISPECIES: PA0069 family radical SAM protein [unclassified Pseudomonas]|uniref:PA0069 family radical SAM protein n=1 Tax=unclassified Pseudomonas TaxID=196821 RepID=UPI001EE0B793|nr:MULTISPECIES: PA0069 family radical SAM protein [unclassified Pseudomonas]MCG4452941.1 PA0069 family radical SAM protein [Pseudomonas sp. MMS21 TM103]
MSVSLPPRGRGTASNPHNRFAPTRSVAEDDGWYQDETPPSRATEVRSEMAKSVITRNNSPDVGFDRSVNPYRGCEHGCIYCFARPSHAYWDMSPGIDFETRLIAKTNLASRLEEQLQKPGYVPQPIALGINTDAYQPIEREQRLTRQALEILLRYKHPLHIITKGSLILRDLDLLSELASQRLVSVAFSLTTLDDELKRIMEPRAASPGARLRAMRTLHEAGVPVGVICAPMIPLINDSELERLLEAARDAGAGSAGYVLLRLPLEIAGLFEQWLQAHFPERAAHVMSLIRQSRGGKNYDSRFGSRMRGEGPFAELLAQRFRLASRKLGLDRRDTQGLDCSQFCPPGAQLSLL